MIEIVVSDKIRGRVEKVYELLKDYNAYKDWWLIPTETFEGKDNYFQFSPIPFIKIGLEEEVSQPNKKLGFKYVKGPFRGQGIWEFYKIENNETGIKYTIKLEPTNQLFRLIANTKVFEWKHSQDIKNIIRKIEKKAAENTA